MFHQKYPRILFISANADMKGTRRLTYDFYQSLVSYGCNVDLMLKDEADISVPHIFFVSKDKQKQDKSYFSLKESFSGKIKRHLKKIIPNKFLPKNYYFFYTDENHPPFNPKLIIDKIEKKYDLVIIFSWEDFIGAKIIELIYDKLHVPIFLLPPDFCAITGGCHYFYDCIQYKTGCKNCPGAKGQSFPHYNALERKRIWNKTNLVLLGNDYTENIYKKSFVYGNRLVIKRFPAIDETIFCERDRIAIRKKLALSDKYKYVIAFGAQSVKDPRKGMAYLKKSLKILYSKFEEKDNVILLIAGKADGIKDNSFSFKCLKLGYLSMEQLAEMYAVADVFLSPSIEDAGPMMVNQALSCGTPVVAFEVGTALSVVKGKGTGYIAKMKDAEDFANGIYTILTQSSQESLFMRKRCREIAMKTTSFKAAASPIIEAYHRLDLSKYEKISK